MALAPFSHAVERINGCKVYTDKSGNFLVVEGETPLKVFPASTRTPKKEIVNWVYDRNRELAMQRDRYQCVNCSSRSNLQCHHKVHRGMAGGWRDDRISNLETLCNECHAREHGG